MFMCMLRCCCVPFLFLKYSVNFMEGTDSLRLIGVSSVDECTEIKSHNYSKSLNKWEYQKSTERGEWKEWKTRRFSPAPQTQHPHTVTIITTTTTTTTTNSTAHKGTTPMKHRHDYKRTQAKIPLSGVWTESPVAWPFLASRSHAAAPLHGCAHHSCRQNLHTMHFESDDAALTVSNLVFYAQSTVTVISGAALTGWAPLPELSA